MKIGYKINRQGFSIELLDKSFSVIYPETIWESLSESYKRYLVENIVYANTNFLGLLLGESLLEYQFPVPNLEPFFFKNTLYDLLSCEIADEISQPLEYVQKFYNQEITFIQESKSNSYVDTYDGKTNENSFVLPFTFGKESLLTVALLHELNAEAILMYVEEPVQPYEAEFKNEKLQQLNSEFNLTSYFIKNEPGMFRYGKAFDLEDNSEIGWGTQTTTLALYAQPIVHKHKSAAVLFGSEYSNNEWKDYHNWKAYLSYDQTTSWTAQQNSMVRIASDGNCGVYSTLEPLEEITIFYILHHRYPEFGKYQFSCMAEKPLKGSSQWCHECHKCTRMYLFAVACGFDPKDIGFEKNLLNEIGLFENYFGDEFKSGSETELDFAFYCLHMRDIDSVYVNKFREQKLPHLGDFQRYIANYTKLQQAKNLIPRFSDDLNSLFSEELSSFKQMLKSLNDKD